MSKAAEEDKTPRGMGKPRPIADYPMEFHKVLLDVEKGEKLLLAICLSGICKVSKEPKTARQFAKRELKRFGYYRLDCKRAGGTVKYLAESYTWRAEFHETKERCLLYITPHKRPDNLAALQALAGILKGAK